MRSLLTSLMLGCVLCACSAEPEAQDMQDAGSVQTPSDAGDAGSESDAGDDEPSSDAGGSDAGFDAGDEPSSDAGVSDAGDDEPQPDAGFPPQGGLAADVRVRHVALFQAVKVPLASDGVEAAGGRAPVVSGRDAVVRAWVEGSMHGQVGLLDVETGEEDASLEALPPEVFPDLPGLQALTFHLPAALVRTETRFRVRVITPDGGEQVAHGVPHDARYPADGSDAPLQAQPDPGALRLVLVPVQYDTDGSHRLPDTSPEQLERMRSLLLAVYPATEVELTVREPIQWNVKLKPGTNNLQLGILNRRLADLRVADDAHFDVYYYGLIAPASTLSAHCGRVRFAGCTTGQSWVVTDPSNADQRLASGVGFTGDDSIWTLIHELGHMHGRRHAPCGASSNTVDNDYPYPNAPIGTWGYDATSGTLVDPDATKDFMSYCDPTWVSDYTWQALYERIAAVNALAFRAAPERIATFVVDVEDGEASPARRLPALSNRIGEPGVEVALLSAHGAVLDRVTSRQAAVSHGGVTLFVPAPPAPVAALAFTLDGVAHRVPVAP